MNDIKLELYNKNDRDECINLLNRSFAGNSDENTFKWRFESPSRPEPLLLCAKHNKKVVSFLSFIPWEFKYKDGNFLGYQAGELATDFAYRGQGLASKLFSFGNEVARDKNIDFLFSFPKYGSPSAKAHYKAGYSPIGNYYTYMRFINPFYQPTNKQELTNIAFFQKVIVEDRKITPVFDKNYFDWRYINNPKNYEIVKYKENNNQAVFILRKRKLHNSKLVFLMLIDCQFTSLNGKFINNAFKYLDKLYSRKALFITTFLNPITDKGRAISNCFKIKTKSRFEMLCIKPKSNHNNFGTLLNYNNWEVFPHLKDEY